VAESTSTLESSLLPSRPLMRVAGVCKTFPRGSSRKQAFTALHQIDLEIPAGKTVAIVGVSGAGKSTLAMCMAQLESIDTGEIWYKGQNLAKLGPAELALTRRQIQLLFQDPAASFNPRLKSIEVVEEPLEISRLGNKDDRRERGFECMRLAGLSLDLAGRSPIELSGGQRQRLAIARALTLSPELLIFDESFSGLDLVLEAQILELLEGLRMSRQLAYIIISHDLTLVAGIADQVAVMQSGKIVEQGPVSHVFLHPQHAHTRALLAASPAWDLERASGAEA
jgi:oligopeptide transport system ATP-binding protein